MMQMEPSWRFDSPGPLPIEAVRAFDTLIDKDEGHDDGRRPHHHHRHPEAITMPSMPYTEEISIRRPAPPLAPEPARPLTGRGHARVADAGTGGMLAVASDLYCVVHNTFRAHVHEVRQRDRVLRYLSPEAAALDVATVEAYVRGQAIHSMRRISTGNTEVSSIAVGGLFLSTGSEGPTSLILVEATEGHYAAARIIDPTRRLHRVCDLAAGEIAVAAEYEIDTPCPAVRIRFEPAAAAERHRRRVALWQSGSTVYLVAGPGELQIVGATP